ncbi:MAG: diaminopimelate epimerase [Rhabdochlamydiaceae bacterium]|nr:diaminopimelate epimerase [Rhabdochlamydiaceae bacterium]
MISFAKYHGLGNDFILIDDREEVVPLDQPGWICRLCDRRLGIGADGVILLQLSELARFRMRIFNADGSEPAMCGNGIRCLVHFIRQLGIPDESLAIETASGVLSCRWENGKIAVRLGVPQILHRDLSLEVEGWHLTVHLVDTGVPHCILFVPDVSLAPMEMLAPVLRSHPRFGPHGANVNFASLEPCGSIALRTFERGVEGETLACGTGAAAVGWMACLLHELQETIPISTRLTPPGASAELLVRCSQERGVELIGPAVLVFQGNILI